MYIWMRAGVAQELDVCVHDTPEAKRDIWNPAIPITTGAQMHNADRFRVVAMLVRSLPRSTSS